MRDSATHPRSRRLIVTASMALACLVWGLSQHAAVAPAGTPADVTFSDGVLRIVGDIGGTANDRHALRCRDGFVRVGSSQVPDEPVRCSQVREVVATPQGGTDNVDMSQMSGEFGPGGPIEIKIFGGDGSDSLVGAPQHVNFIYGGTSGDRLTGGEIADRLVGGPSSDILDGRGGADSLSGGPAGDLMYGDKGNDSLFGGPGNDALNGGAGRDKLVGGPGRDREAQGYQGGRR